MRKLRLIATGGTIACVPTSRGLAPQLEASELLGYLNIDTDNIDCVDLFSIDSSNVQPEEWCVMARAVNDCIGKYDGVVITHGTDTLAYTASMLSFMLRGINIPVILTGAQFPIVVPQSDGKGNLEHAIIAARQMDGGVYVCFGGSIIKGCRAVKTRTTSLDAFESINYPIVGTIANNRFIRLTDPSPMGEYCFSDSINSQVALIKLIPGTSPRLLDSLYDCGIKGVVIEAFGLGGVHNVRRDHTSSLIGLMQKGVTVILASQCLYERSSPNIYEVSRGLKDAGIIPAYDMTTEAAVTKLMWALGQSDDRATVERLFAANLCDEITPEE